MSTEVCLAFWGAGSNKDMWNTGWIRIVSSSFNLNVTGPSFSLILKGPNLV